MLATGLRCGMKEFLFADCLFMGGRGLAKDTYEVLAFPLGVQALPFAGGLLDEEAGLLVTFLVFRLQAFCHTTHCPSWAPSSQMAGQGRSGQLRACPASMTACQPLTINLHPPPVGLFLLPLPPPRPPPPTLALSWSKKVSEPLMLEN